MEELEAAIAKNESRQSPWPGCYFWPAWSNTLEILQKELLKFLTFHGLLANCPKSETFHRHSNFETKQECFRVQNYRPISLTSTLCKLMERIIHVKAYELAHRKQKLHFYQTAFRTHHSTTDQLFYLNQSIIDGFQEKPHKKTLAVFLYLSSI
ncbi:hypothetical protein TNCV_1429981 [Trichonephila clavipes]|nr:hypothetical protein TNCV_1429981 [Trichonephila clavipes]